MQHIVLKADKRIADVAVVKVPDANELFVDKAYVVLDVNIAPSDALKEELSRKRREDKGLGLKEYEIPREIEFISELPRNAGTDKVDYRKLEEMAKGNLYRMKKSLFILRENKC